MSEHEKAARGVDPGAASDNNSRNHYNPQDASLPVVFTRFDSTKPLSKTFNLVDGVIIKTPAAQMTNGQATRIECDFADFGGILDKMTVKQAIGFGTHDAAQFGPAVRIVTAANANPPASIARTKAYFQYRAEPGVLMLDHDPSPFGRTVTPAELIEILAGINPGFNTSACLIRGSVSSMVHRTGEAPKESASFHLYFPVPDASDIPRFGAVLYKRLWLAGHGFIALGKSGAMLERTLIDGAVFSPERLDFAGRPVIESDELEYARVRSEYIPCADGEGIALKALSPSEESGYLTLLTGARDAIKPQACETHTAWIEERLPGLVDSGTPEPEARKQLVRLAKGGTQDLPSGYVLHFATLGTVTVADVLADPKQYDGQALADPIEGTEYGRRTAKFFANIGKGRGKPCVHSLAHGAETIYFLNAGAIGATEILNDEMDGRVCDFRDLWKGYGVDVVQPPYESIPLSVCGDLDLSRGEGRNHSIRDVAEYPEPLPLPELPPVPPFDVDLLPDDLRGYVEDCANRARFPADFAAVSAMAALGSLVGRKLGIRLKQRDDWTEYGNLWGVLVGPPSSLKSPAMRDSLRPLKVLQAAADEAHKASLQLYVGEIDSFKLRKGAKKKAADKALSKDIDAKIDLVYGDEPEEPVARTYWTSDVTAEKLGVLLAENGNGLLIERDELASFLSTLDDEKHAAARGLYLSGWSGKEGYRFDRIMRGTTFLPKFAIAIIGGIQPGPLARYVRQAFTGERADGLLQRFQLAAWPDSEGFEYVDQYPNKKAKEAATALFKRLDSFDGESMGCKDKFGDDPPYIHLSPAAQEIFIEWYTTFMREQRAAELGAGQSSPLVCHFGKYPGLVGKLALVIHVADDPNAIAVSEITLLKALAWLQYLTPHAERVYHATSNPETGAAALLLARLKHGDLPGRFNARDIYRKCWHGLNDSAAVKGTCSLLLDYGWLIQANSQEHSFGRPSDPIYSVSPRVAITEASE